MTTATVRLENVMLTIRYGGEREGFTLGRVGGAGIVCEYYPPNGDDPDAPETARRLVAAWNAAAGIKTDELERRAAAAMDQNRTV